MLFRSDDQPRRAVRVATVALIAIGIIGSAVSIAQDRKSAVQGKSVDLGGRCIIKKKKNTYSRLNIPHQLFTSAQYL